MDNERRPSEPRSRNHVAEVYDQIADHFSSTRRHPWPEVEEFLRTHRPVSDTGDPVALDVGCGNGRHTELLAEEGWEIIGLDSSRELLKIATERLVEASGSISLVQADAAALPARTNSIHVALYVATLHHLPNRTVRVESLSELARVLAPDGVGLVSVWSTDHDRFENRVSGFDTMLDWTLPGGETLDRFYHIYDRTEFEADLKQSGLAAERVFVSSGNCYAVVGP